MAKDLTLKFKVTDEGTVVLDKISQKISAIDQNTKKMSGSLSLIKWDSIVNLGARAVSAGEQVYGFARSIATSANEVQRQAEIMGLSTDAYQKLAYAAKMADVSNEQFATGMKFLARSIEEAKAGTGDAGKYFKALGIDVDTLSDVELKLEPMTYRLADAFKSVEQGTGKTATAIGLFGRSGQELVPYFNQGADSIKAFGEEAVKLGSVLGDVVLKKGSEAEQMFKQLEGRINSLKISLAPGAKGVAEMLQSVFDVDIKKSWEKMKKDFEDMFKDFEAGRFFPIKEILSKAVFEADEGMAELKKIINPKQFADPEGIKRAKDSMHDWLSSYRIDIDELNDAMSVLGTKSTQGLLVGIKDAEGGLKAITAQFRSGKISVLDYANAIQALTKQYQAFTGGDVTKELVDLEEKTSEALAAVDKSLPDWQKQMAKITDAWIVERNKIQEKSPVYIRANLSKWEEDLREALRKYNEFVSSIKPVNIEGGGVVGATGWAAGQGITMPGMSGYEEKTTKWITEFVGTGLSPEMPLGDAFDKINAENDRLSQEMKGLKYAFDFSSVGRAMGSVDQILTKLRSVQANWNMLISLSPWNRPEAKIEGMGKRLMTELADQMKEGLDQKFTEQLGELKGYIEASGKTLTGEIWERFMRSQTIEIDAMKKFSGWSPKYTYESFKEMFPSYQFGIPYVPKTGLAMVHEGERISPKNVRYGDTNLGGVTIYVEGSGDPIKVANEVAKVLKYRRSSQLRESING